jgi:hypothetical protein
MRRKYSEQFRAWFEAQTKQEGDCVVWTGTRYSQGYGRVKLASLEVYGIAHRIAFEMYNAEIPEGLVAMHICDNRLCVNPNHIVLGTNRANMYDMKRKHRSPSGERHHAAKLTMEQAHRIREAAKTFDYATHGQLAKQFGVSRSTVTKILSGQAYRTGT